MKEIPSLVISAANNDIESLMKESSTKNSFYKTQKTEYLHILLWNLESLSKNMGFEILHRNLVVVRSLALCLIFELHFKPPVSKCSIATTLCFMPYILVQKPAYYAIRISV